MSYRVRIEHGDWTYSNFRSALEVLRAMENRTEWHDLTEGCS